MRLLSLLAPPLCWSCEMPAREGEPLCGLCRGALRWLGPETVVLGGVETWAPVAYEGPARALVGALKFRGAVGVADVMAAQMAARLPERLVERSCLVPVPIHPARLRRRGFNQAQRLARVLARRTGVRWADCLERGGPAARQVGQGRGHRSLAVRGAIRTRANPSPPVSALLVDDVATTGATLAACAAALRADGTRRVAAVAYARTPGR